MLGISLYMRVQTRGWGIWLPLFEATVQMLKCLLQVYIDRLHLRLFPGPLFRYHLLRLIHLTLPSPIVFTTEALATVHRLRLHMQWL
ncbi:hypothetical protein Gotri_002199 [Gossypium trilobum]|uniref:Uncharacterized protein n=1 Tax=Gossypium trilobum TaxID=34281 RepID=A0A7J9F7V0_9ROSI|nr:hypothetical protein [Gossypium trilobum]